MSTIKSNNENMTINADGASSEVKFQANGVEKASISAAGAFTSTSIDATKLTGNLPAISAANLTAIPAANITGTLPAISGANLTNIDGGKVLQVLQDSGSGIWSSSSSYIDTGATVTITPSATSSKIAIFASCPYEHYSHTDTDTGIYFQLLRGSTQLKNVLNYRQFYISSTGVSTHGELSMNYLDTPSTTSATTYKIQFRNYSGVNANSKGPSLIVMEIGA